MDATEIQSQLGNFNGTESYYKHPFGIKYTDGVQFLAEKAEAYWLIDAIASYNPQVVKKDNSFVVWHLKKGVKSKNDAMLTARQDTGKKPFVEQHIEYTDFPLDEIYFYQCSGVVMLRSEY